MNPYFAFPKQFHYRRNGRKTERTFLFKRTQYRCWRGPDWCFVDRDGRAWRPLRQQWYSDGASVPHPFDWLIPAFYKLRYRKSTMGIHDPACRDGQLEWWDAHKMRWIPVDVPRSLADSLLQQGIEAEGGWALTRGAYWLGVRIGSGFRE